MKVVQTVKDVYAYISRTSISQHPACSPNLFRSDFHSFPILKAFLDGRRLKSEKEMKDVFKVWCHGEAAEIYDESIQNLVTGYYEGLNAGGDCIGK